MSTSLYWKPMPPPTEGISLGGHPLKGLISSRCLGHDGSLGSDWIPMSRRDHLSYVCGLRDAGVEGAEALVIALNENDEILVRTIG